MSSCYICCRNTVKCRKKIVSLEEDLKELDVRREELKATLIDLETEAGEILAKQGEIRVSGWGWYEIDKGEAGFSGSKWVGLLMQDLVGGAAGGSKSGWGLFSPRPHPSRSECLSMKGRCSN